MILIIINILQQFPDNSSLHGNQINCLNDHRHHSSAHQCCVQFDNIAKAGAALGKRSFSIKMRAYKSTIYTERQQNNPTFGDNN